VSVDWSAGAGRCRSCEAEIVWVKMVVSGKNMPLDADPDPEHGNIIVTKEGYGIPLTSLTGPSRDAAKRCGVELRVSHFATCPNADQHRRRLGEVEVTA
jgi:hypothetical protein